MTSTLPMSAVAMSIAIVAAPSVAMCNMLPDVFDESTGYVTMETKGDASTEGNQSFFNARNWSDGLSPHGGTNYYVSAVRKSKRKFARLNASLYF